MRLPLTRKLRIVSRAREIFARDFPLVEDHNSCLYQAASVIEAAEEHGVRLCLQAGSAWWRRLPNGEKDAFLAYVWELNSLTIERMQNLKLPEMHVWAADPQRQEIVDITTGIWPTQCEKVLGKKWVHRVPPEFFWGTARDLKFYDADAAYRVDMGATLCAAQLLKVGYRVNSMVVDFSEKALLTVDAG